MGFGVGFPKVDLENIGSDMNPSTPNVFDIGKVGSEWRNARIGQNLVIGGDLDCEGNSLCRGTTRCVGKMTCDEDSDIIRDLLVGRNLKVNGNLTVEGTTTTIESQTLVVADKNIELASTASPTDVLADGGGITLRGDTDKTILWNLANDRWNFNRPISTGNLQLNGNTLSSLTGDLDIATQTGGVFKFANDAFRSGQDANNYLEIGHGGSNSFVNQVGVGGIDLRFSGVTKATFTTAGHLHLMTDTDQKHTLKIITANNLNDTGIAWENSGGAFTHTIFRTDVGSNRADLVFAAGQNTDIDLLINSFKIHGGAADEGKLEVLGVFQISSGNPGIGKVWTDAGAGDGIGTWTLSSGGGFTDAGDTIILTNINDSVGIGESGPDSKFHVTDGGSAGTVTAIANTIATFESPGDGYLSILTPNANERGIFFGEPASNVAGAIIYNSSTTLDGFEFRTNGNVVRMSIDGAGITKINGPGGVSVGGFPSGVLHVTSDSSAQFSNAAISGHSLFGGNTQLWHLGSVSGSNDDVLLFNRQAGNLFLGTNNTTFFTMNSVGSITVGLLTATQLTADNLRLDGNVFSSIDTNGAIVIAPNGTGAILLTTDKTLMLGSSPAATGDNSELVEMRDDRTTTGANPNYVLSINQQNSTLSVLSMGNDGNADAILVTHNNDLRIGNDVAGVFTENVRFTLDGKTGFGTPSPDASALLDLTSTTKGFLPPRMTTTQIDAIVSPATGLESYDTIINKKKVFTGAEFKTLLTEDIGQVVAQDSFASNNVRYFGELGLPGSQTGWTETGTGVISIEVGDNVFGVIKDTVKHFSTTGNSTKSESPITGTDWDSILAFGASFSAITRITEDISTNGMFAGVGFSPANDPRASSIESRTGMFISVNATHTTIALDGQATVILDGTGGNPLVLKDDWFTWEAVINPTPDAGVNFGAVDVYVNNVLITTGAIVSSNNVVSNVISLANSSSSGQTTFYADNFGITIYEESATKTLSVTLMSADVAQITIPEGRRDYTIILPDGNPRDIGAVLRMVVNNLFGKVTLENQNPAAPEILYNGLRTFVFNVNVKEIVDGVNTISSGNVYLGFQTSDIDRTRSIFAQLSSSVDQDPADTNPTVVTYNTQDAIAGITHSTTVNPGEITIDIAGTYAVSPQPQVGKTTGGVKVDFDLFWQIDRGAGFVDEVNSNVKLTIKDADITDVIVSAFVIELNVGDKIRMMQKTSATGTGMGLKNTDPVVGPPTVPRTPSIILSIHRVGGLAA